MKILKLIPSLLLVTTLLFLASCSHMDDSTPEIAKIEYDADAALITYSSRAIPDQYIVIFKEKFVNQEFSQKSIQTHKERLSLTREMAQSILNDNKSKDTEILRTYGTAVKGFVAQLSGNQVLELRKDDRIAYIEEDQVISINGKPSGVGNGGGGTAAQETPWGITRIGGATDGTGKRAWIIDSGIDLDHEDLNVNTSLSQSFLSGGGANSADDQNGHGTHVAGTVAAVDNGVGVIGVAAGAEVIAVRVLDRRGSGSTSGVIAGVDYVGGNASSNDAANMSLGGGVSTTLDNAVINASSACPFALAAGNESDHADNHSPARANGNNIYTISASDINDNFASFSNYGNPPVDYCAPGVSIKSTWKSGGYNTISGTSMASPHVCGLLLLGNISTDGNVNGDPDNNADSMAHN